MAGTQQRLDERIALMRQEMRERFHEIREMNELSKRNARKHAHGKKAEQVVSDGDVVVGAGAARVASPFSALVAPTNTRVNSKASPESTGSYTAGEAEQSIAVLGQYGLCAWNDGRGFYRSPTDVQSYGVTTDGGATWTDMGILPKTGTTITYWSSDPVVTVNEKTGEFYYCGLTANSGSTNGLGVARGHFVGSSFVWDGVSMVSSGANASFAYDKQWLCADSLTGNLYATWTRFTTTSSFIWFSRSTDGGATWSAAVQISGSWEGGLASGSRPAVGPNGEVYVTYAAIGSVDADSVKVFKSTNAGVSFGPGYVGMIEYDNYYTGAPGFNRARAVTFPSIAVDRTTGCHRGRIYLAIQDAVNLYADTFGATTLANSRVSVESDNYFARATLFSAGNTLRGTISSTTDNDYFKFNAVQGTTYLFWADSVRTTSFYYNLRVYCPNDTTVLSRLSFSGDGSTSDGTNRHALIAWTAPSTNTYFLRMTPLSGTGGYRIRTTTHTPYVGDIARDQRDAVVAYSDDATTWSTRKVVNDDIANFDNWLPEVAVGSDGNPYVMWYDWRDTPACCGGGSNIYLSRSLDGGTTWVTSQTVTTATTANWTQTYSNIAPNQGDYNGMYGGDAIAMAWADARPPAIPANGTITDPDVWAARLATSYTLGGCPGDQVVTAGNTVNSTSLVSNLNSMFSNDYAYTITCDHAWPGYPMSGTVSASASGSTNVPVTITVPDTAADQEVVRFCITTNQCGADVKVCCFNVTVSNVSVPTLASLASTTAEPGLVKLTWMVETRGSVALYRSADGAAWTSMGSATPASNGLVTFTDNTAAGGARYAYRVGIVVGGSEAFSQAAWVNVPVTASFGLNRVFPSPATSGFSVSFALPNGAPATLDVIDLAGRRVFSQNVGALGAGSHTLSLVRETGRLPIGVYAVRLSQGSHVATAKVSVVR